MFSTRQFIISTLAASANLSINKKLLRILGINKTVMLCYYLDADTTDDGWFCIPHKVMSCDLGISETAIRVGKMALKDLELIDTKMEGMPAKEKLKINYTKFTELLTKFLEVATSCNLQEVTLERHEIERPVNFDGSRPSMELSINNNNNIYNIKRKIIRKKQKANRDPTDAEKFLKYFPKDWQSDPDFQTGIEDFVEDREKRNCPLSNNAMRRIAIKLLPFSIQEAITAFANSIEFGWRGVFPQKQRFSEKGPRRGRYFNTNEDYNTNSRRITDVDDRTN